MGDLCEQHNSHVSVSAVGRKQRAAEPAIVLDRVKSSPLRICSPPDVGRVRSIMAAVAPLLPPRSAPSCRIGDFCFVPPLSAAERVCTSLGRSWQGHRVAEEGSPRGEGREGGRERTRSSTVLTLNTHTRTLHTSDHLLTARVTAPSRAASHPQVTLFSAMRLVCGCSLLCCHCTAADDALASGNDDASHSLRDHSSSRWREGTPTAGTASLSQRGWGVSTDAPLTSPPHTQSLLIRSILSLSPLVASLPCPASVALEPQCHSDPLPQLRL